MNNVCRYKGMLIRCAFIFLITCGVWNNQELKVCAVSFDLVDYEEVSELLLEEEILKEYPELYLIYKGADWGNENLSEDNDGPVSLKNNMGAIFSEYWDEAFSKSLWNFYGEDVMKKLESRYNPKRFSKDKNVFFETVDNAVELADMGKKTVDWTKALLTEDVDQGVQLYITSMRMAAYLAEQADIDNPFVKGSIAIAEGAAGFAKDIANSEEYQKFKSQYDTKLGFTVGFWQCAMEGIIDCIKDIPNELKQLAHDDELWNMIFSSRNEVFVTEYLKGALAPAPGTVKGLEPEQTIFGNTEDAHVVVDWGMDINDFNVQYFD